MNKVKRTVTTLTADDFLDKTVPMDFKRTGLWQPYPLHQHAFTEINLITSGALIERINGRIYRLHRGNVVILTPGDTHETPWAGNAIGMLLRYLPDHCGIAADTLNSVPGYNALFTAHDSTHTPRIEKVLNLNDETCAEAEHILTRISREFSQRRPGYVLSLRGLLLQYIVLLSRYYTHMAPLASYQFARLLQTMRFIEMNYTTTITLDHLAAVAAMKRRNFIKVFSDATGLTPIQYLIHYRVSAAAVQLRYTADAITSIALQCGFSDSNYFARQFQHIMHMTPTQYRHSVHSQAATSHATRTS